MRIRFERRPGGGSLATVERSDGVTLLLTSYDRKYAVPHDLAHFTTERALRLSDGLWGSIAAGAVFDSLRVVAGRPGPRARARSAEVRRRNAATLALVEVLVGAVHGALGGPDDAVVDALGSAWGSVREGRCPFPPAARRAALTDLRALGDRLAADGGVDLRWP